MVGKLTAGAIGTEVERLHQQLQRHNIEVPAQEVRRQFFGPGTRAAVLAYQRQHGLDCSGEVDWSTTAVLCGNPPRAGGLATSATTTLRGVTRARTNQKGPATPEPSLYDRLGGICAIAAVIDRFSDALVQNPSVGQTSKNPAPRDWHTNNLGRLPALKFMRTLWVCDVAGGPFPFTATRPGNTQLGLKEAHRHLCISPHEFDAAAAEFARTLDGFNVPPREKQEVLGAFDAPQGRGDRGVQGRQEWFRRTNRAGRLIGEPREPVRRPQSEARIPKSGCHRRFSIRGTGPVCRPRQPSVHVARVQVANPEPPADHPRRAPWLSN